MIQRGGCTSRQLDEVEEGGEVAGRRTVESSCFRRDNASLMRSVIKYQSHMELVERLTRCEMRATRGGCRSGTIALSASSLPSGMPARLPRVTTKFLFDNFVLI